MAKKKIIFQGEPGANSHIACRDAYPDHEPVPCPTFEDCFSALTSGDVDLGMIPIENSVAGRVADIHHLMPESGLHIIAEWFLPIRNQLMAPKGATLKTIKTVQSHIMALGQCRNYIRRLGKLGVQVYSLRPEPTRHIRNPAGTVIDSRTKKAKNEPSPSSLPGAAEERNST